MIGFVLTAPDLPTIYIIGDNASLALVQQVADRFGPVDTAVLFAGAARTPLFDGALLTLDSAQAAEPPPYSPPDASSLSTSTTGATSPRAAPIWSMPLRRPGWWTAWI